MAQNIVGSKENVLKWLSEQIGEDDCVIVTDDLTEAAKGKKGATVKFKYFPDTFLEDAQNIRPMLEAKNIAIWIGSQEKVSAYVKQVYEKDKNRKTP